MEDYNIFFMFAGLNLDLDKEDKGNFQLKIVTISRVINHMTCRTFKCSHWWKIYFKKSFTRFALQSECCISTNESIRIITGRVIYNPAYTCKFQLKTTIVSQIVGSRFASNAATIAFHKEDHALAAVEKVGNSLNPRTANTLWLETYEVDFRTYKGHLISE